MTPAQTRMAIAKLMADGRERTLDDILRKVPGNPDDVKSVLNSLVKRKAIRSAYIGGGKQHHVAVYKAAKDDVA